jgi:hypothetical protein
VTPILPSLLQSETPIRGTLELRRGGYTPSAPKAN